MKADRIAVSTVVERSRLIDRDNCRVGLVEVPCDLPAQFILQDGGSSPFHYDEQAEVVSIRASTALFDAIPVAEIVTSDLPTVGELEDDDALARRFDIVLQDFEPDSVVYFGIGMTSGLVKIGYSSAYLTRQIAYFTESAEKIAFFYMAGSRSLEKHLHERFLPVRHHNEWHWPHEALLHYIQRACYF